MTDPTKQAATAKTAREVIKAHVEALGGYWTDSLASALRDDSGWSPNFVEVAKSYAALRALLDAPEGGVQRLCEAGESLWREVLELLNYANGKRDNITPRLEEILCDLTKKSNAHFDALAALRASPESVGGAAPSGRAAQAINTAGRIVREAEAERDNAQRTASSLSVELAVAAKERDALKADLAAARKSLERAEKLLSQNSAHADRENLEIIEIVGPLGPRSIMQAIRDCAKARDETTAALVQENQERIALAEERDTLKADLAAARGEVERLRTEIAGDSHACANGAVRPYPSMVCSLCVSRGHAPPPATEAPISERAGAVLVSTVRIYLGDGGVWRIEDAGPLKCEPAWGIDDASICVRLPGRVAAAAERAVKGGAWS